MALCVAGMAFTACQDGSNSSNGATHSNQPITHNLCVSERVGNDSLLRAMQPRHGASTLVSIDSLNEVNADFGTAIVDALNPEDPNQLDDWLAASGATSVISFSQLQAALSAFALMNACTSEEFAQTGCATYVVNPFTDEEDAEYTRLNTSINGQNYVRRVEVAYSAQGPWSEKYRIEGAVGDLGNVRIITPVEGEEDDQLIYQRLANGEERIEFISAQKHFLMKEQANCTGSFDYEATTSTREVSLNSNWVFTLGSTSGSIVYSSVDLSDNSTLSGNYSW